MVAGSPRQISGAMYSGVPITTPDFVSAGEPNCGSLDGPAVPARSGVSSGDDAAAGYGGRALGARSAVEQLGQPEIEQLDLAVVGEHRIGSLDVAVQHVAPVRGRESACEPDRELDRELAIDRR